MLVHPTNIATAAAQKTKARDRRPRLFVNTSLDIRPPGFLRCEGARHERQEANSADPRRATAPYHLVSGETTRLGFSASASRLPRDGAHPDADRCFSPSL